MGKKILIVTLTLVALALLAGCMGKTEPVIHKDYMDLSVQPGVDFFSYVNGTYVKNLVIPDDRSSYDVFSILRENANKQVNTLLEEVSKSKAADGTIDQKIRDFYNTAMNVEAIEAQGAQPLKADLDRIEALDSKEAMLDLVADMHCRSMDPFFGTGVMEDLAASDRYAMYLVQAGVGLPDVEYYTKKDKRSEEIRETYVRHMAKMFSLLGDDAETATANAQTVMALETTLAKASKTLLEMRNFPGLYNPRTLDQLQAMAGAIDWNRYFEAIGGMSQKQVIVMAPKFVTAMGQLVSKTCLCDLKTYLRWNLVNRNAEMLSEDFVKADYAFYSEFLSGSKAMKARWKRVTQTVSGLLGEPLGQLYVREYFPPESKERMVTLVENLREAFKQRIQGLEWMSDPTKEAALTKLAAMRVKIGYPDKWRDYSGLEIGTESYLDNVWRVSRFDHEYNLNKLDQPVDPEEWVMSPQTVNAGYSPLSNDITFPAGILQPPYFNPQADDAVNYGAIGVVIGHEMTHGFDDQGRHFDDKGNMRDWWSPEDAAEFNKRTALLVEQYNRFKVADGVYVNGQLTLGENIADFGGLTISLKAYELAKEGQEVAPLDGFTDLQRFFLSYGSIWRGKTREKALIRQCQEDVHPWGKVRVNGAPFNVPAFYQAFDISPEDPLYIAPEERPVIW